MSGTELAEKMAPLQPQAKVLYMSGYTNDSMVRHGVLEQQVLFLQKPFTPASFARKVREVLDGRSDKSAEP
jgi:FixJ family two-component response regulator